MVGKAVRVVAMAHTLYLLHFLFLAEHLELFGRIKVRCSSCVCSQRLLEFDLTQRLRVTQTLIRA